MRLPLLLLLSSAFVALAAVSPAAHAGGLPVCNAKHKRPANPYGSVLAEGLRPVAAEAGPSRSAVTAVGAAGPVSLAPAAAKPTQVSRAALKASLQPCGSGDRT